MVVKQTNKEGIQFKREKRGESGGIGHNDRYILEMRTYIFFIDISRVRERELPCMPYEYIS